jgi:hypothetical protein
MTKTKSVRKFTKLKTRLMIRFPWRIFFKIFARVNVYVRDTRTLALLPCGSLGPSPAAAGERRVLSALMKRRPIHLYERDAKYNQRRMAATEVGFGATFSAAILIGRKINRAKTRHSVFVRLSLLGPDDASPERRCIKDALQMRVHCPITAHLFPAR